jgi:membrane protein involved in colicin uptake
LEEVNDTADTDIAKAAEAVKQQMDNQRIQDAEFRENEQRVSAIRAQNAADQRRIDEDNKRKRDADKALIAKEKADAAESARKAKAEEKIRSAAESTKARQEAQDRATAERKEAAALKASADARAKEDAILRSRDSTSSQRIAARDRIDAMSRTPSPSGMKKITPDTIRASIQSAASKTPAKLSSTTTNIFGSFSDSLIKPATGKSQYKQESRLLSRAITPHAKMPVTGGKVTPILHGTQISVSPNYIDSLLGRGDERIRTHQKKGSNSGGLLGSLDNFVKRI